MEQVRKEEKGTGATPLCGDSATDTAGWFERVKKLVDMGLEVKVAASGYSMWPALSPEKDTVTLGPATDLRRGDIVLASCSTPSLVVLHRVSRLTPEGFLLMGDSNLYQTEICALSRVAGKVVAVESQGRLAPIRRGLSAAVQTLPAAPRRFFIRVLNLFR